MIESRGCYFPCDTHRRPAIRWHLIINLNEFGKPSMWISEGRRFPGREKSTYKSPEMKVCLDIWGTAKIEAVVSGTQLIKDLRC